MCALVKRACSDPFALKAALQSGDAVGAFARLIAINIHRIRRSHRIRVAMRCNKDCVLFNEETTD